MSEDSFGRRALAQELPKALLDLEVSEGRGEWFAAIDTALAGIAIRAICGERVVELKRTPQGDQLHIIGVPDSLKTDLRNAFQLEEQQARGAWFVPEAVSINADTILFSSFFREAPRYAHTLAGDEKGKFVLSGNPDAMIVWAVLSPLFDHLLRPIWLRVEQSGLLPPEEFSAQLHDSIRTLTLLGLSIEREVAPFAWRGGFARFDAEQQIEAKRGFLRGLAEQVNLDVMRRYRALITQLLIARYYEKSKKGPAKRRQVITKEYARALAFVFVGDWLGFIRYLGEPPHDEERIVTAIPETKLIVSGRERAADLAAKKGVPVEEVERIFGAFWQQASGDSPILERTKVLAEYWHALDELHARQAPGMQPLSGVVEEQGWNYLNPEPGLPFKEEIFRRLLAPELLERIERLWGTTVLVKWPNCVISSPFPHSLMSETLGPALKFWHGCALTAWFVCHGPYSRTEIPGLAEYYRRELATIETMGCPVQQQLFDELKAVQLGPEETFYSSNRPLHSQYGFTIEIQTSTGKRRRGFELLRDVITRHRRQWSSLCFDTYLRALWESELKAAGRQWQIMTEEKGKPPTLKQFAKYSVDPACHWFGGDVGLLYAALGQKLSPLDIKRTLKMPRDRVNFANTVFQELGGVPFAPFDSDSGNNDEQDRTEVNNQYNKLRLSYESLGYVQLSEALGRPPTLQEFRQKFEWLSTALSEDSQAAWEIYATAIQRSLARA